MTLGDCDAVGIGSDGYNGCGWPAENRSPLSCDDDAAGNKPATVVGPGSEAYGGGGGYVGYGGGGYGDACVARDGCAYGCGWAYGYDVLMGAGY